MRDFVQNYAEISGQLTKTEVTKQARVNIEDLTEGEWAIVAKIVEVFACAYEFTKKIQSTSCTLSDFYGHCHRMEIAVGKCLKSALPDDDKIAFDLPENLLDSMNGF